MLEQIYKGLVVSCQALPHEPLHSSYIMSRLAVAAEQGGAVGIRANSKEDIIEIKKATSLGVIGIVKRDYSNSDVFITATTLEVDELIASGCEMIALDATDRQRPNGQTLEHIVSYVRGIAPHVQLMADISSIDEGVHAQKLGFDCISTTLYGYTKNTSSNKLYDNDFKFLKELLKAVDVPVIAEGNVMSPDMFKRCLDLGAYSVVVGGAITRPLEITKRFVSAIFR